MKDWGQGPGIRGRRPIASDVSGLISMLVVLLAASVLAWTMGDSQPWPSALPGYVFRFPRDHASHPDYRIEWWYYTGNLASDDGHRYGFQLTFFRVGMDYQPENPSRWAARDLYMAHLAVTDINGRRFRFAERLNRAGPGWAGAATDAYHVWNEGWEVQLDSQGRHHLHASDAAIGVDLILEQGKPPVLEGENGYSRKGREPGNASEYYSLTRMPTRGTLWIEGERVDVRGLSWMDHEFGSSFLEEGQTGWDWFSLQLDDGTEIMLYQLRRAGGAKDPHSAGTLVGERGDSTPVNSADFTMVPTKPWRSPSSGAEYPTEWHISIPAVKLDLTVRSALENQELRAAQSGVTYWEGAVIVNGVRGSRPLQGRGYLEMTGYSGLPLGTFLR